MAIAGASIERVLESFEAAMDSNRELNEVECQNLRELALRIGNWHMRMLSLMLWQQGYSAEERAAALNRSTKEVN